MPDERQILAVAGSAQLAILWRCRNNLDQVPVSFGRVHMQTSSSVGGQFASNALCHVACNVGKVQWFADPGPWHVLASVSKFV